MGRLTVTGALVCWLVMGCEYTSVAAESGALACTNGLDEDGDHKADCADPDCWGYATCRVSHDGSIPMYSTDPPPHPVDLPDDMGAFVPPDMTDSGTPIEPPVDASMTPDATTDAELPLVCDPSCPEDLCVDGVCTKPPSLGYFVITSLEIAVPRAIDNACLDPDAACTVSFPCCMPDPALYVSVAGVKLGFKTANDTALYVWQAPGFTFELHEYDEIKLEVLDDDANDPGDTADDKPDNIFECTTQVTPADVEAGSVRCAPGIEGTELTYPYGVTARFAPMADAP